MSNGFKRAFSIDVKIDFVGVFDTVNSVGAWHNRTCQNPSTNIPSYSGIIPRELPFAKTNHLIRVFRHAVALDERRAKFKANLWGRATKDEERLGDAGKRKTYHRSKTLDGIFSFVTGGSRHGDDRSDRKRRSAEHEDEHEDQPHVGHHGGRDCSSPIDRGHETDVKG